jgi:hypothetical protein
VVVLRAGLVLGGLGFLFVTWASWSAGYAVEVALARGALAFMAASVLAYLGELVIATAPPPVAEPEPAHEPVEEAPQRATDERSPVPIGAFRDEREAA